MNCHTTVVNVRTAERGDWDVYIGRSVARAADWRCRVRSIWGNPFRPGRQGVRTVEEAVDLYESLVRARLRYGGECQDAAWWRSELLKLRGKRLGCWCHPDPCHGHALVRLLDEVGEVAGAALAGAAP